MNKLPLEESLSIDTLLLENLHVEGEVALLLKKMVVLVVLFIVFFSQMLCKAHTVKCKVRGPHYPQHMYHQPGDLIIGGIATYGGFVSDLLSFTEDPPPGLLDSFV